MLEEEEEEPMEVNSSSSSSEIDDADEELNAKAEELERQLEQNKYLYNVHEELVKLYRQIGDLKSMRLAYERFHEYFPLTPEIWLAWINDEKKLANSESEIKNVFALFDKATKDYLSVSLWVEYAQYSIGASTLETTRQILEKALTAAGLHTSDGSLLWDTLRELEYAHLLLAPQDSPQSNEQISKIVEVFRRQLSIPLVDMENTYKEWKEWLEQLPKDVKINTEPVEWGYKKAIKTLGIYKPFEDKLQGASTEEELSQIYKDYIQKLSDPSTILCVYERAVAQMCLNPKIWLDYCLYALKLGDLALEISERALRNCSWSEELYVLRLRILEQLNKDENEILICFEHSLSNLGNEQSTELWLAYLEYMSRNSNDKEKLFKCFDQALDHLQHQEEGAAKVTKWYARLLGKNGNMQKARQLWKQILKMPKNRKSASIWLEFANLERQYGELQHLRSLFQRAITICSDWPIYIAEEWLMFERENGTLGDVMNCIEKRKDLLIQPQKIEPEIVEKVSKRKLERDSVEFKRPKIEHGFTPKKKPVEKDPSKTVFVSNLHTTVNAKRLKKFFPNAVNIEIVEDRKGNSRCYGYVQFNLEEEVMVALARDRELFDARPVFISNCKVNRTERKATFKYSLGSEENKLFVKNLPPEKTEEDIENVFKPYGVKAVRLVRRRDGQSKGMAYVEFEDAESAKKARDKTDQMTIDGQKINVAISAPPPKMPNLPKQQTPIRHARSKLQVPLIPRTLQVKNIDNGSFKAKSNEDFRNMLLNK